MVLRCRINPAGSLNTVRACLCSLVFGWAWMSTASAGDEWIGPGGIKFQTWPEFLAIDSSAGVIAASGVTDSADYAASDGLDSEADADPALPPDPAPLGTAIILEGQDSADGNPPPRAGPSEESQRPLGTRFQLFEIPRDSDNFGMFGFQFQSLSRSEKIHLSTPLAKAGFGMTWLDGPSSPDLPGQLYNVGLDIGTIVSFNDKWTWEIGVTPGWYTDWKNLRPEAFRLMGRAVAFYQLDSQTQWVGGFVYLNRDDIPALPVLGIIWDRPLEGQRWELVFPQPKVSLRVCQKDRSSRWLYLAGELGGGSWAIKRFDRTPDVITSRDLRATLGIEARGHAGSRQALEAGWIFDRSLSSRTGRGDYSLNDSVMIRLIYDY